jgi:hypothetical protein
LLSCIDIIGDEANGKGVTGICCRVAGAQGYIRGGTPVKFFTAIHRLICHAFEGYYFCRVCCEALKTIVQMIEKKRNVNGNVIIPAKFIEGRTS